MSVVTNTALGLYTLKMSTHLLKVPSFCYETESCFLIVAFELLIIFILTSYLHC